MAARNIFATSRRAREAGARARGNTHASCDSSLAWHDGAGQSRARDASMRNRGDGISTQSDGIASERRRLIAFLFQHDILSGAN